MCEDTYVQLGTVSVQSHLVERGEFVGAEQVVHAIHDVAKLRKNKI